MVIEYWGKTLSALLGLALLLIVILVFLFKPNGKPSKSGELPTFPVPAKTVEPQPLPKPIQANDLSMLPRQFVVLDLETTGLDPAKHEIIEFGAIRANRDSDKHDAFQALVRPKRKIPRRITEITGITQAMVDVEGRDVAEVLAEFITFIQDLPLVTFNASFDMGFLRHAANRQGIEIGNRYTCALKMARKAWPDLPSYCLADLAKMGQVSDEDTHRAVGDCKRALIIFIAAASQRGKRIQWSRLEPKPALRVSTDPIPK
jgi:DNA polymerase III subunit epsilon